MSARPEQSEPGTGSRDSVPPAAGGERHEALTFESAQRELEQIVDRLESGRVGLEEAIALWQRGEELYRFCLAKLDAAQGEIEELAERVNSAQPARAPFPDTP